MLLILEGADGAGKTTLLQNLVLRMPDAVTIHHGPAKGIDTYGLAAQYMDSLLPALRGQRTIIDRAWISESIYAEVYRGKPSRISPDQQRLLEHVARAVGGVVIYCDPGWEAVKASFLTGREEMLESPKQLWQVYEAYNTMLRTALPVLTYNYKHDTADTLLTAVQRHIGAGNYETVAGDTTTSS